MQSDSCDLPEVAVLTSDGVKGVDAAWISEGRIELGLVADVLTRAPEICVEVLSERNTREEIDRKRDLYIEAGADEVWICDSNRQVHFFLKNTPDQTSKVSIRCPMLPETIWRGRIAIPQKAC